MTDKIHRSSKNNNLNQSIVSQNSPPFIIAGLVLYSSAKIAEFKNNLREIINDTKLNKNIIIENFFFPIGPSPIEQHINNINQLWHKL